MNNIQEIANKAIIEAFHKDLKSLMDHYDIQFIRPKGDDSNYPSGCGFFIGYDEKGNYTILNSLASRESILVCMNACTIDDDGQIFYHW